MKTIEFDAQFGDKAVHIEVSAPLGVGGAIYYVMINKYYNGDLMKAFDGWRL
jgi:hypothetical protein